LQIGGEQLSADVLAKIEEKIDAKYLPIDILKTLTGGLTAANVFVVDYGETGKLGVLKISSESETDCFELVYQKAKENGYHQCIAKLMDYFEILDDENNVKYVCLYELAGDSLDENTIFRLIVDESQKVKHSAERITDFLFNWNKKHERLKLTPIHILSNCLHHRLNDQKYVHSFSALNIPNSKKWIFFENGKEFLPNLLYFLTEEPDWRDKEQRPIKIHCLQSLSHGDFHSKNIIFSNNNINVIDLADVQEKTNIFYDLLYLELHTLIDLFSFKTDKEINKWISLSRALSKGIREVQIPDGNKANILRDFINTLRKSFNKIVEDKRNSKLDCSFFLAGVAAGINFFRKTPDLHKKAAAFIYASYFLKAALEELGLFYPAISESTDFLWEKSIKENHTKPLKPIKYNFIGMGAMVGKDEKDEKYKIKPNRIFLDTGNNLCLGAIDLHQSEDGYYIKEKIYRSTTGVIAYSPNFLIDNLFETDEPQTVEIVVHEYPDFDCFASAYIARNLITEGELPKNYEKLVEYVEDLDTGLIRHSDSYLFTPYAIANAIDEVIKKEIPTISRYELNLRTMERGLELIEYLMNRLTKLKGSQQNLYNPAILFEGCPFDKEFSLIQDDHRKYMADINNMCEEIELELPVINQPDQTKLTKGIIWKGEPSCILHKYWARKSGFVFTFIPYPPRTVSMEGMEGIEVNRVVISVNPRSDVFLGGLCKKIEESETAKESLLFGEKRNEWRSRDKRKYTWSDNRDPWFSGQNFNYTITDSPFVGSLLTIEEIRNIVMGYYQKVSL
jgi:hypothetical protein